MLDLKSEAGWHSELMLTEHGLSSLISLVQILSLIINLLNFFMPHFPHFPPFLSMELITLTHRIVRIKYDNIRHMVNAQWLAARNGSCTTMQLYIKKSVSQYHIVKKDNSRRQKASVLQ